MVLCFPLQEKGGSQAGIRSVEAEDVSQVQTGKGKVPSYQDYLDLFGRLLDCDHLTVLFKIHNQHFTSFKKIAKRNTLIAFISRRPVLMLSKGVQLSCDWC